MDASNADSDQGEGQRSCRAGGRNAAAQRRWRLLFLLYALALTIGTHWPRLELGSEKNPAPDKLLHLCAFAGLAVLLWRTGWIRSTLLFAALALSWAALDEVTQGFPGLGRETSWQDLLASSLGVVIAVALRWALAPVGGAASRAVGAFHRQVFDHLILSPRNWLYAMIGAAVGMLTIGTMMFMIARWLMEASLFDSLVLGAVSGTIVGAHVALEKRWRDECKHDVRQRPCRRCGVPGATDPVDQEGLVRCGQCAERQWIGQWREKPQLPRAELFRLLRKPVLVAAALGVGLLLIFIAAVALHPSVPLLGPLGRWFNRLPGGLRMAFDLTTIALVLAVGLRLFRQSLAALMDRQHLGCLRCGHDLRATPTQGGTGHCGECGTAFFVPPPGPSAVTT